MRVGSKNIRVIFEKVSKAEFLYQGITYYPYYKESEKRCTYLLKLYVDNDQYIIFWRAGGEWNEPRISFQKWLEKESNPDFFLILRALTLFLRDNGIYEETWVDNLYKTFRYDKVIDNLLSISNGALLYNYQFEFLLQMCGYSRDESRSLRKLFQTKRIEVVRKMESIYLPNGQSVGELFDERSFYRILTIPDFQGSNLIYRAVHGLPLDNFKNTLSSKTYEI